MDPGKTLFQNLANQYMAAHPNVTIHITILENEAFKTKLTSVMQGGTPPDIFQSWGGGVMNDQITAGMLQDITPALDANGGAWRSTFAPGALAVYAENGKNYGVPWDMGMVGWWYNKDLFAKAKIASVPTTWDDLLMSRPSRPPESPPSPWVKKTPGPVCTSGPISPPASADRPNSWPPPTARAAPLMIPALFRPAQISSN